MDENIFEIENENTYTEYIHAEEQQTESDFAEELENYLPTPENTDKIRRPMPEWIISVIASFLTCVILLTIYSVIILPNLRPRTVISYTNAQTSAQDNDPSNNANNAFEKASKSVVSVRSTSSYHSFFGVSTSENTGSGIILTSDGYILTSASLASSKDTQVTFDGKDYSATTVGIDGVRDIAIIKIDAQNLPAISLADSGNLKPGDNVVAISNIIGKLGPSMTTGIVCGINHNISVKNGSSVNLIQTDALTGSSSTGGCILNKNGEVIGMITSAFTSNAEGISFAIPSNDIKTVSASLISTGEAPKGLMIGITGTDSSHGVLVESVLEDSPAEKAGIKIGDLILKIEGTPVTSVSEINKIRDNHKTGDTLNITIYSDGEIRDIRVVL